MSGKRAIGEDFEWVDKMIGAAWDDIEPLSDNELDFLTRLADRLHKYGDKTFVSEKQLDWLKEIRRKLEEST